jgi:hypothetical protein
MKSFRAAGLEWSFAGVGFGVVGGLLWVPVQLLAPPEPDFFGSLVVGAALAIVEGAGFGLVVPWTCSQIAKSEKRWTRRRALILLLVVAGMAAAVQGVFPLLLTRDIEVALRLGIPRTVYVLVLGRAYIWVIERECGPGS